MKLHIATDNIKTESSGTTSDIINDKGIVTAVGEEDDAIGGP